MINIPRALKDKVYSMQKIDGQQNQKDVDSKKEQRGNARNKKQCNRKEEKNPYNYAYYFQIKEKPFVYKGIKIRIASNSTQKPSKQGESRVKKF